MQQLVILADKHGVVDMTAAAIARRTTIPVEIIEVGLRALEQPDPESRSPDEEGRRIVPLSDSRSWGWRLVNYDHYRKMRSEEERREYHRVYARKRRAAQKGVNTTVNTSTLSQRSQPIAVSSMQEAGSISPQPPEKSGGSNGTGRKKRTRGDLEVRRFWEQLTLSGIHHATSGPMLDFGFEKLERTGAVIDRNEFLEKLRLCNVAFLQNAKSSQQACRHIAQRWSDAEAA